MAAEKLRGKEDAWNGVCGGFAAGAAYGALRSSLPLGVGTGAMFAVVSVIVEATGGHFQQGDPVGDGQTPRKTGLLWQP